MEPPPLPESDSSDETEPTGEATAKPEDAAAAPSAASATPSAAPAAVSKFMYSAIIKLLQAEGSVDPARAAEIAEYQRQQQAAAERRRLEEEREDGTTNVDHTWPWLYHVMFLITLGCPLRQCGCCSCP